MCIPGLSGLLPMHPTVYIQAWRRRIYALEEAKEKQSDPEENDDQNNEAEMKTS